MKKITSFLTAVLLMTSIASFAGDGDCKKCGKKNCKEHKEKCEKKCDKKDKASCFKKEETKKETTTTATTETKN